MDEENKTTEQTTENPPERTQTDAGDANGAGAVSFDELLKQGHQAEFDRRVSKALATAKARWEREQEENASEAKRLERMTAAQRERYQLDRDKADFAKQQAAFAAQQMQVSVGVELQKRGLDAGFAKYLAGQTAEESSANLAEFEAAWNRAISAAVTARMRGNEAPKEARAPVDYSKMSDAEYYTARFKKG